MSAPVGVPVNRESFGIPATEDPWSQVPDPSDPLVTARSYFEHFLHDNGGLRKENDGEPRRYANGEYIYLSPVAWQQPCKHVACRCTPRAYVHV
jgi:hypothetical protein